MASDAAPKGLSLLLKLSPEKAEKLSLSAARSGRSKTREALVRLEDSLESVADLASPGLRFPVETVGKK